MDSINHKAYLGLAFPFIISTVTQPLLGAVDTAVVGHLESASYIGGVALGAVIFNTMYWLFGFLRVSTSGFSAQSMGSSNPDDRYYAFFRPLAIALLIGLVFLALQSPIIRAALYFFQANPEISGHAETYFNILIWGAPLVLTTYVNLGWLMGRKLVRESLFLQISTNVLNIILDLLFVLVLKLDVAGVAWATLISQTYGFFLGIYLIYRNLSLAKIRQYASGLLESRAMKKLLAVNGNLMIRTVCLLAMTNMFMAKGSELGETFLAANAVLFQVQYIVAYFFDGLGNASSVFAGKAVGEQNLPEFKRTVAISNIHAAWLSLAAALVLLVLQNPIIQSFTNLPEVISLCNTYMIWLFLFPLVMGVGLVYAGLYTGATYTAPLRNSLVFALILFAGAYYIAIPRFHNHGLWFAFTLFSLCRSGVLIYYLKKLIVDVFPVQTATSTESGTAG